MKVFLFGINIISFLCVGFVIYLSLFYYSSPLTPGEKESRAIVIAVFLTIAIWPILFALIISFLLRKRIEGWLKIFSLHFMPLLIMTVGIYILIFN